MVDYRYKIGPLVWDATLMGGSWSLPAWAAGQMPLSPDGAAAPIGLFWARPDMPLGGDYADLGRGDIREIAATASMLSAWQSLVGYSPVGGRLVDLLWDHLTAGADPDGLAGPKPLMPERDRLALHLAGHSVIRSEPFQWGVHPHTAKIRRVLQADLEHIRDESQRGLYRNARTKEIDRGFHQGVIQALLEKYKCEFDDLRPAKWPKDEKPKPHDTTVADNFNRADNLDIGADWAETGASHKILSNTLANQNVSTAGVARHVTALSGTDQYSQGVVAIITPGSGGNNICVLSRLASGAGQFYLGQVSRSTTLSFVNCYKFTGSWTQIGSNVNVTVSGGETLKGTINGSSLELFWGGVSKITQTDTTITGNLYVGTRSDVTDPSTSNIDDYEGGDISAGPFRWPWQQRRSRRMRGVA